MVTQETGVTAGGETSSLKASRPPGTSANPEAASRVENNSVVADRIGSVYRRIESCTPPRALDGERSSRPETGRRRSRFINKDWYTWRMHMLLRLILLVVTSCTVAAQAPFEPVAAPKTDAPAVFRLRFDEALQPGPYTGRVYVAVSKRSNPRGSLKDWFNPPYILASDVAGVLPKDVMEVNDRGMRFPSELSTLPPGEYTAQAIARRSLDHNAPGFGEGDLYSEPVKFTLPAAAPTDLVLSKEVARRPFHENDRLKLVEMVSPRLSSFHGREVRLRAGVALPKNWTEEGSETYPVVYFIHGFGGDHTSTQGIATMLSVAAPGAIIVVPDPTCYWGHSVFADSETNGPRGAALMEELIPEVEKRFRGGGPLVRYVTGISSGGWSSLWLQITYPDQFAGCWSHSPDPVDFRDFQLIDLYAPGANMYRDADGNRRPIARDNGAVRLWYDDFVRREDVLGPGGQIASFEAVFSPRENGLPRRLFDRESGAVDAVTAKAWEKYDIRLVLERNWDTLGPQLAGKIRIYAGGADNFYLETSTEKLKESLRALGSDAVVEILPGAPHTIHNVGLRDMAEVIKASQPAAATP